MNNLPIASSQPPFDKNLVTLYHSRPVVLDGELAVPSQFNRAVPETRYSRVEFLLQGRVT